MSGWETESAEGLRLVGQVSLPRGEAMQLMTAGKRLFCGQKVPGKGTSVIDVTDPKDPGYLGELPPYENTYSPKVQVVEEKGLLYVNYEDRQDVGAERVGFAVFDLNAGEIPKEIAYIPIPGKGVHRMWCDGPLMYLSAVPVGYSDRVLMVFDVADPTRAKEIGRWWIPGLHAAAGERPSWPKELPHNLHHAVVKGDIAYMGCWDAGMKIVDVADPTHPTLVSELGGWAPEEGGATHTALPLPGRDVLVLTDESTTAWGDQAERRVRTVDISDLAHPTVTALFPRPEGDFHPGRLRLGPHNFHEPRSGAWESDTIVFVTYQAAGLRVYDVSDASHPREVAHCIPRPPAGQSAAQINDIWIDGDGVIYLSDRGQGGVFVVEMDDALKAKGWRAE